MISQVTFNKEKWIAAMMLDPVTGLDPPDVKIRAAEGIHAASTFIQGYWIWYFIAISGLCPSFSELAYVGQRSSKTSRS
jgi:hypothetical protein